MGRAGRDGLLSTAILYYNASDIATNVEYMQDEMRQFCTTMRCKRQFLAAYFSMNITSLVLCMAVALLVRQFTVVAINLKFNIHVVHVV